MKAGIKKNIRKRFRHCGIYGARSNYAQVFYYQVAEGKKDKRANMAKWRRKYEVAIPRNKEFNNKRSIRFFEALVESNYAEDDLLLSLDYNDANLPSNEQEAKMKVKRYIQKVNYYLKKQGKENAKWILVTEIGAKGRIHHHLLIKCDLDRDILEKLWIIKNANAKGENIEKRGTANSSRLRPGEREGLLRLINYIAKEYRDRTDGKPHSRRKWECSQNLIRPWETINDHPRMMSKKKFNKMKELPEDCEDMKKIIEGDNPGYELINMEKTYIEELGQWFFFCRLRLSTTARKPADKSVDKKTKGEVCPKLPRGQTAQKS